MSASAASVLHAFLTMLLLSCGQNSDWLDKCRFIKIKFKL